MAANPGGDTSRGLFLARVLTNEPLCRDHWRFVLEAEDFPPAVPGQFVQVLCGEPNGDGWTGGPLLRRPFSIGGLSRRGPQCEIDIMHRVIGTGTRWLSRLRVGDRVSLLGPFGTGFRIEADRPRALLVGGGVGLPPLVWLAQALRDAGKHTVAFCGARTADVLPLTRRVGIAVQADETTQAFEEFADSGVGLVVATDDGSLGSTGTVASAFIRYLDRCEKDARSAVVYTCGPQAMMRAVALACEQRSLPCQVCLERMMACGMGTCQSCVVAVRDAQAEEGWRYRLCCMDGPVFDGRDVVWES